MVGVCLSLRLEPLELRTVDGVSVAKLLIANRGEIAIRVARAAADLGIETATVYSEDDVTSLHTKRADTAIALTGSGSAAYLDVEQIVTAAVDAGADALHPGYGFLSENPLLAARCADAGVTFVGPPAAVLEIFGDKAESRVLATQVGVPVLDGTDGSTSVDEARDFFSLHGGAAIMLKAVGGGGGRGMRVVTDVADLEEAYERCASEASAAFGNPDLYVERLLHPARHIEIQILGDRTGAVTHLGERECSIQRRHQKIVEIAPAPALDAGVRSELTDAATRLAKAARYENAGTVEFLVGSDGAFAFIETNARLQVEHTVTEAVTGVDLVKAQISLAGGATLAELGLAQGDVALPRGSAIETRVNMETMGADGAPRPSGGTLAVFEPPTGPGVRVDSYGYGGYSTSPSFDSMLAKVIVHADDFGGAVARSYRALGEFRIEGVPTNIEFLKCLLQHEAFVAGELSTSFVDDHLAELLSASSQLAVARVDDVDPLAVLDHGKSQATTAEPATDSLGLPLSPSAFEVSTPEGTVSIEAPVQGTIVSIAVAVGDAVHLGQPLLVMESMKMEHVVTADTSGFVRGLGVSVGDAVYAGHAIAFVEQADVDVADRTDEVEVDLDEIRPDLAEAFERHAYGFDEQRPDAVARRRKTGQRTVRENVDDLIDEGTLVEYGPLVVAAQRRRRDLQDLIERTPGDGMVTGIASVNGDLFGARDAQCVVVAYDYTVLAGTQGLQNHRKKDRMFELANELKLPVVFFTEGGGGRPGDTDGIGVAGLDCWAFTFYARLSGLVPLVGITSGRCFAGNAVMLGMCDIIIATEDSNIVIGGPAMIEGGGLGVFRPEEVGPMDVQVPNGVVDIPVADEAEAAVVAKKYLSYFQGALEQWEAPDQRLLRRIVPENRLRIYDIREVIDGIADIGSVLEIRPHWGDGVVTALVRIEGRPVGVIANNPAHLAGAIDSPGADKGARFIQLCDAFDIPILFLCDCPGIMVGPEIERTALVRHACRMFVNGANVTVPFMTVVLRKAYGLGAQAMAGGSFKAPAFVVSWPTGEFGGMGLEGAVKLGYRKELAAVEDAEERKALYEEMVARMYEHGKAINTASHFELDDVIDPADTRQWITSTLRSAPPPAPRQGKKRPNVDVW